MFLYTLAPWYLAVAAIVQFLTVLRSEPNNIWILNPTFVIAMNMIFEGYKYPLLMEYKQSLVFGTHIYLFLGFKHFLGESFKFQFDFACEYLYSNFRRDFVNK